MEISEHLRELRMVRSETQKRATAVGTAGRPDQYPEPGKRRPGFAAWIAPASHFGVSPAKLSR